MCSIRLFTLSVSCYCILNSIILFILQSLAAFLTQTVCLDDTTVKFEIWDTAGQERYHSLAPMYYRGAQAAIVVYDITNQDTFSRAKTWVKELQRQASPNIVIALAGNKADLSSKRMVEYEVVCCSCWMAFLAKLLQCNYWNWVLEENFVIKT